MSLEEKNNETYISSNTLAMLSYVLPPLSGIYFFIFEKRNRQTPNKFVLFHAYQSITFGVAAYLIVRAVSFIPYLFGYILNKTLAVAAILTWMFLVLKAHSGSEFELPYLGKIAKNQAQKTSQ
ncbi:MAG: hypothetical protein KatS3mg101_0572 [Patescibacteria group bacterium]|nr:MAG: hypothetical protein KatS3mg101_0572 [Patescibacteria group bacterium]